MYGFAIFSMFFGSGNLVFPLQIGIESGNYWVLGFLGLFITGIILPFLGLFVIKIHRGSYESFFSEARLIARFIVPLFTLSLLGSFGVVPRCITVAYGGMGYVLPKVPLIYFSLIFCIISFIICLKDHFMVSILGKWMTPILLISLFILIGLGIINAPSISSVDIAPLEAFRDGFLRGYQTMDLFAAFFFSSLIFKQIQESMPGVTNTQDILRAALKPSIIGITLLSIIYLGFVFLGAHYQSIIINQAPELILTEIAAYIIGEKAALLIGITVVISCITTAVALNNIYARYLCKLLTIKNKCFPLVLLVTTTISFLVSLLDFQGIAAFLSPALKISYPSLILLTILSILLRGHKSLKMAVFYGIILIMLF
jgi:LIVCS family branched-chain amino acid:cation transporter